MSEYFLYDYSGNPFVMFGTWHLVSIVFFLGLNFVLLVFRQASEKTRRIVRIVMALILWVNEAFWHIWNLYWGHWEARTMLPLHVCSLLIWLAGFMLVFRNYRIYEFAYFLGIGGALQGLLTPDAGIYGFPHYRVFQTQIAHGMLIAAAVYMTSVEGFRPTWKSMLRVIVWTNVAMVIIFGMNAWLGSNFMYVQAKPDTPTLLDYLPAWPWYIPFMELFGLTIFLLLYLPFIVIDWRAKRKRSVVGP